MDNPGNHEALSWYNEITAFNPGQHNSACELTAINVWLMVEAVVEYVPGSLLEKINNYN